LDLSGRQLECEVETGALTADLAVGSGERAEEIQRLQTLVCRVVRFDLVSSFPHIIHQLHQVLYHFIHLLPAFYMVGRDPVGPKTDIVPIVPPG